LSLPLALALASGRCIADLDMPDHLRLQQSGSVDKPIA